MPPTSFEHVMNYAERLTGTAIPSDLHEAMDTTPLGKFKKVVRNLRREVHEPYVHYTLDMSRGSDMRTLMEDRMGTAAFQALVQSVVRPGHAAYSGDGSSRWDGYSLAVYRNQVMLFRNGILKNPNRL